LIDHLYCRDCEEILSPTVESVWGVSRVSRFSCTNNSCKSYRITVYLNHCLNGKCNSVIDSRDSKKCTHGLYICSNESCGTCCSHKMFSTRLGYLEKVKAHVPPNLSLQVANNEGHQERGEHFCYSCGVLMDAYVGDKYHCSGCNIVYKLGENRFDRVHSHLSEQVVRAGSPPEQDLPFG
jgi:hypothetical protein